MSSFLLKKKHRREALLFCFNLKKSAAESHRMLVKAYGDNALSETMCRDWFRRFNDNFDLSDKKRENRQEGWGLSIAGSFGRGRYLIAKNAWRAIECFSSSHFHAATCHEEGSKDRKMGAAWTIGRWSDAKTHAKFCLPKKKVVPDSDCDRRWKVDLFSES